MQTIKYTVYTNFLQDCSLKVCVLLIQKRLPVFSICIRINGSVVQQQLEANFPSSTHLITRACVYFWQVISNNQTRTESSADCHRNQMSTIHKLPFFIEN